jgi:hypothetical protein
MYFNQLSYAEIGTIPLIMMGIIAVYFVLKKWPVPGMRKNSIWIPIFLVMLFWGIHWAVKLCCVVL